MEYGKTAFSASNKNTMEPIPYKNAQLGGEDLSPEDEMELNILYDCKCE